MKRISYVFIFCVVFSVPFIWANGANEVEEFSGEYVIYEYDEDEDEYESAFSIDSTVTVLIDRNVDTDVEDNYVPLTFSGVHDLNREFFVTRTDAEKLENQSTRSHGFSGTVAPPTMAIGEPGGDPPFMPIDWFEQAPGIIIVTPTGDPRWIPNPDWLEHAQILPASNLNQLSTYVDVNRMVVNSQLEILKRAVTMGTVELSSIQEFQVPTDEWNDIVKDYQERIQLPGVQGGP